MSESRYKVVEGSQSAHCCFECTVVDTTRPVMIGGKHYEGQFKQVCETFGREEADMICAALNAACTTPMPPEVKQKADRIIDDFINGRQPKDKP